MMGVEDDAQPRAAQSNSNKDCMQPWSNVRSLIHKSTYPTHVQHAHTHTHSHINTDTDT